MTVSYLSSVDRAYKRYACEDYDNIAYLHHPSGVSVVVLRQVRLFRALLIVNVYVCIYIYIYYLHNIRMSITAEHNTISNEGKQRATKWQLR